MAQGLQMSEVDYSKYIQRAKNGWPDPGQNFTKVHNLPLPTNLNKDRYKNKWERDYASCLEQLRHLREVLDWSYENVGFRLADGCFFYPDFFITYPGHFEVHDVKGFMRDDALVKLKVARDMYPHFKWAYTKKKNGIWEVFYI